MRIIVFLVLVAIIQTFMNEAYSQKSKLPPDYTEIGLKAVLDDIEKKFRFFSSQQMKVIH